MFKLKPEELSEQSEDPHIYEINNEVPYFDKPDHRARSIEFQPNHKKHKERVLFKRKTRLLSDGSEVEKSLP